MLPPRARLTWKRLSVRESGDRPRTRRGRTSDKRAREQSGVQYVASVLEKVLRLGEGRLIRKLENIATAVNSLEPDFSDLTDEELRNETAELRERFGNGETLDDLLPEAFAAVREASKRTVGLRHFDVQIMGGAALHLGNIAEMKTGEGKTLVATLHAYLIAIAGKDVHVITVNDSLS